VVKIEEEYSDEDASVEDEVADLADELFGLDEHFDALFELLIEKKIISRDEFNAKLKQVQERNDTD